MCLCQLCLYYDMIDDNPEGPDSLPSPSTSTDLLMADTAPAGSNKPNGLPSEDLRQIAERISASAENWGRKLLDLSRRNKLLNFKAAKVSTVTIVDEQPSDVFRKLFLLGEGMKFRATEANLPLAHGDAVESPETDSDRESTLGAGEDGSLNLDFVACTARPP